MYLGQNEHHKVILFLLGTILRSRELRAELHIVGDGSQFKKIAELAKADERVHVYGRVDRRSLPELFDKVDVTIVPSLCYENSPTVIFESFAFGVPVIASNIEGVAELIREGENGIMFAAGDADSLRDKMLWASQHRKDLAYMGSQTKTSLTGLSRAHYLERLLALYTMK
jgi:glycosyltransferase involved in cell wall biosynthesis